MTTLLMHTLRNSRKRVQSLRKVGSTCNLIVISTVMIAAELTIHWNKIQNANSLSSAGQRIPLFIGIGAITRIIYVYYYPEPESTDLSPPVNPIDAFRAG
jgi:hypothetical protein